MEKEKSMNQVIDNVMKEIDLHVSSLFRLLRAAEKIEQHVCGEITIDTYFQMSLDIYRFKLFEVLKQLKSECQDKKKELAKDLVDKNKVLDHEKKIRTRRLEYEKNIAIRVVK